MCACEHQTSPLSIHIHYIDQHQSELGLDEHTIDFVCQERLTFAECTLSASNRFASEWNEVMNNILRRTDYGSNVSLESVQGTISLYGLAATVQNCVDALEEINVKEKCAERLAKVSHPVVGPKPVKADQSLVESKRKPPVPANDSVRIPQTYSITFDVDQPGFEVLVNQEPSRLLAIVKSNGCLEKQILNYPTPIVVPNATVNEFEKEPEEQTATSLPDIPEPQTAPNENWFFKFFQNSKRQSTPSKPEQLQQVRQAMPNAVSQPSMTIGPSKIIVCTGDLSTQQVSQKITTRSSCRESDGHSSNLNRASWIFLSHRWT